MRRRTLIAAAAGAAAVCVLAVLLIRGLGPPGGAISSGRGIAPGPAAGGPRRTRPSDPRHPERAGPRHPDRVRPRPARGRRKGAARPEAPPPIEAIEGLVRDEDGPRAGALVRLFELLEVPPGPGEPSYREIARTIAIEDGSFRFARIPRVGRAFFVARAPMRASAVSPPFPIDDETPRSGWVLAVARGAALEGTVVARGKGTPIQGARVRAECARPLGDGPGGPAFVDLYERWSMAGGVFSFDGLPEGALALIVEAPGFARRRLEAATGGGRPLRIELEAGASIEGTVLDPAGRPVPGARVAAATGDPPERYEARTRDDGSFTIDSLPAGAEVELRAEDPDAGSARRGGVRAGARDVELRMR